MALEAVIRILNGTLAGFELAVAARQEVFAGRRPDCALHFDDGYASRRHFRVFATDTELFAEDAGSSHGTYLNGERISVPVVLQTGDVIRAGTTEFAIEIQSPVPAPMPIVERNTSGTVIDRPMTAAGPTIQEMPAVAPLGVRAIAIQDMQSAAPPAASPPAGHDDWDDDWDAPPPANNPNGNRQQQVSPPPTSNDDDW